MSQRGDVRRMLLARGWDEGEYAVLHKAGATWAGIARGDSALSGQGRAPWCQQWTVGFNRDVPARVIVAVCEAAAEGTGR